MITVQWILILPTKDRRTLELRKISPVSLALVLLERASIDLVPPFVHAFPNGASLCFATRQ